MNLFDALTVAGRRLSSCCRKTLNHDVGDRPRTPHVAVEGAPHGLTVTVDCPACKTRSVIKTDGASVSVDRHPGAAGSTPLPSQHEH